LANRTARSELRPTTIVVHIPKTAGTSLRRIVVSEHAGVPHFDFDGSIANVQAFWRLTQEQRDRFGLILGHCQFGVHRLLTRPFRYVTMLRNPVERVVSLYYYIRSLPAHYMHAKIMNEDLETTVRRRLVGEMDNFQVRFLTSHPGNVFWTPPGQCTRGMLDEAMENLSTMFDVVGICERFDDSVDLLAREFGWRAPVAERLNSNQGRPSVDQLPASAIDAIVETNALDVELYRLAEQLLGQRLARHRLMKADAGAIAPGGFSPQARNAQATGPEGDQLSGAIASPARAATSALA